MIARQKIFPIGISLFLHAFLIFIFVYAGRDIKRDALWSGGRGVSSYRVAYVELGDLQTGEKAKPQSTNVSTASGIGSSTTPAGGIGNGLDASGSSSPHAPNVLAEIRKKIMEQKDYPILAKENGWMGTVRLSFKINQTGQLDFISVLSSSDFQVLDNAALQTVKRAVPLPFYPDTIVMPVEYKLE